MNWNLGATALAVLVRAVVTRRASPGETASTIQVEDTISLGSVTSWRGGVPAEVPGMEAPDDVDPSACLTCEPVLPSKATAEATQSMSRPTPTDVARLARRHSVSSQAVTRGWRLVAHARERVTQQGISIDAVWAALEDCEVKYSGHSGRTVYWRDGLRVIANDHQRVVITVTRSGWSPMSPDPLGPFAPLTV